MKRSVVVLLGVVGAGALFAALVYGVLVAADLAAPAGTTVQGPTARRLWATVAALLALAGVVVGGWALARPAGRAATAPMARVTLGLGLVGMVNGAANLVVAGGGPGTGNGVVGGAAAIVLGSVAVAIGLLALARRRTPIALPVDDMRSRA